jgi:protocatechuate 3,4-dioxygenase beta subunit
MPVSASTTLRGTVFDTLGTPVSGATVQIRGASTAVGQSDSVGHYVLRAPRRRALTVDVTRPGFPRLAMNLVVSGADSLTADLYLLGSVAVATPSLSPSAPPRRGSSAPMVPTRVGPVDIALQRDTTGGTASAAVRRQPLTLRGVVTDTLGNPLLGAIVTIVSQQRSTVTDSAGTFSFSRLVPGAALIRVRRVGFQPRNVTTSVSAVDAVILDVPLSALGQLLAAVTVRSEGAPANRKLQGFYERKALGFGQYVTRDQFAGRLLPRFTDLVNRFSGVVAADDRNGRRRVYGRGRCEMAVYLDGMHIIIPENTSVDNFLNLDDIDAVEVHTGVGQLPPEFSGRTNACGVIAAWTRSRTAR